jgi:ribosome-interacting GTPase 1
LLCPQTPVTIENPRYVYKKAIIAAHKAIEDETGKALEEIGKLLPGFAIVATSVLDDDSLSRFKAAIFHALGIIRVYTKRIGHEPELVDPIVLPIGATVDDAARMLHKDFAYKLQFAKVWGKGKFEGQRVKNSFPLTDGDVVEFHI